MDKHAERIDQPKTATKKPAAKKPVRKVAKAAAKKPAKKAAAKKATAKLGLPSRGTAVLGSYAVVKSRRSALNDRFRLRAHTFAKKKVVIEMPSSGVDWKFKSPAEATRAVVNLVKVAGLPANFDRQDLMVRSRAGVSSNVLEALSKIAPVRVLDVAIAPASTRARWKRAERPLTGNAAAGALRLVGLIDQARAAFGDSEKAIRWLSKPKAKLDPDRPGATPFEVAETEHGARIVEERLYQIAHGIFA